VEANGKALVWLHGEIKTPPFSSEARRTAGFLLRLLQSGDSVAMPDSRPMPSIGAGRHELRIRDSRQRLIWRLVYRLDDDAIIVGEVFAKKTQKTPTSVINACKRRYRIYDDTQKRGINERD
jgi:phage-related protein